MTKSKLQIKSKDQMTKDYELMTKISTVCSRAHQKITSDTNIKGKCRSAQRNTTSFRRRSIRRSSILCANKREQENKSQGVNVGISVHIKSPASVRYINLGRIRILHKMSRIHQVTAHRLRKGSPLLAKERDRLRKGSPLLAKERDRVRWYKNILLDESHLIPNPSPNLRRREATRLCFSVFYVLDKEETTLTCERLQYVKNVKLQT